MDGWNLILAWAIVSIAAIVAGSVRLRKRKGYPGASLLTLGILLLIAPVMYVGWGFYFGGSLPTVSVDGFDPPNDPGVTVNITNQTYFDGGNRVDFNPRGDVSDVVATFQAQYPAGVVTTAEPVPTARGAESIWHVSTDDVRYDLMYGPGSDWYELTTQVVVVHPSGSGPDVRIPFPRSAFDAASLDEGQPYANSWSTEQWADFYADITKAQVDGDTITVPTNRGATATITVEDGLATVKLDE